MTVKVSLEKDGYGVLVLHTTVENIVHVVKDWISYERLQFDLILDKNITSKTMFNANIFLH